MNKKLYALNYPERRLAAFIRSGGRCENMLAPDKRCPVKLGDMRITHAGNLQLEQLICHHVDGDPENPDAELLIICWSCHMKLHRKPGPGRPKASAKKQGYEVIRMQFLLQHLSSSGFRTWRAENDRFGWQIGTLSGDASDPLDAIVTALHWQSAEIADLRARLQQFEEEKQPCSAR